MRNPASRASSSVLTGESPERISASKILGVTTVALGTRSPERSPHAPFSRSSFLLVDTITGATKYKQAIYVSCSLMAARLIAEKGD